MEKQGSYAQRIGASIKEIIILLLIVFVVRTFLFGLYQVPTGSMETTMLVGERFFGDKFSYFLRKPQCGEIITMNSPVYGYSSNPIIRWYEEYVWGPDNWTKRVIGVPGDHIKGVIENGNPVVYRNGKKIHEPYINAYPLVFELQRDQATLHNEISDEIADTMRSYGYGAEAIERTVNHIIKEEHATPRSYDPQCAGDEQPFYRMQRDMLLHDAQGNILREEPYTPLVYQGVERESKKSDQRWNGTDEFDVKLGVDEYWLMGDNRLGSTDSRFWGPVQQRLIHGRIVLRIWSIDSSSSWWVMDLLKDPVDFYTRIRWNRFFQVIS